MTFPTRILALLVAFSATFSAKAAAAAPARQAPDGVPESLFRWSMAVEDLGAVTVPQAGTAGWQVGPNGMRFRKVPGFTADPTYEVVIRAPHSGSATYPERILVQLPVGFAQKPFAERAVVVGFHSYSVSEKDVFLNTDLPFEAARRGWMLVAPYGLTDTSFASPQTQASLEAVFHVLYGIVPFNYRRVYAVGFSMGGLSALSFGMRHLDPRQLQFAGIVVHTGTLDMPRAFEEAPGWLQQKLSNARHFKGSLEAAPFEYERVSPIQLLDDGPVDPDRAPVLNLDDRPIYLHANLADPQVDLVEGMWALATFLQQRGAWVVENLVHEPAAGHHWASLDLAPALDFVSQHDLGGPAEPSMELFVDRPGRWRHSEVEALLAGAFGRFRLELAPLQGESLNSFALLETRDVDELRLRLGELGLSAGETLRFQHESADGTADLLRLAGYAQAPRSVELADGTPVGWSWAARRKELVIEPSSDGRYVDVRVLP